MQRESTRQLPRSTDLRIDRVATQAEEAAYDELTKLRFAELDQRRSGNMLFKTSTSTLRGRSPPVSPDL